MAVVKKLVLLLMLVGMGFSTLFEINMSEVREYSFPNLQDIKYAYLHGETVYVLNDEDGKIYISDGSSYIINAQNLDVKSVVAKEVDGRFYLFYNSIPKIYRHRPAREDIESYGTTSLAFFNGQLVAGDAYGHLRTYSLDLEYNRSIGKFGEFGEFLSLAVLGPRLYALQEKEPRLVVFNESLEQIKRCDVNGSSMATDGSYILVLNVETSNLSVFDSECNFLASTPLNASFLASGEGSFLYSDGNGKVIEAKISLSEVVEEEKPQEEPPQKEEPEEAKEEKESQSPQTQPKEEMQEEKAVKDEGKDYVLIIGAVGVLFIFGVVLLFLLPKVWPKSKRRYKYSKKGKKGRK